MYDYIVFTKIFKKTKNNYAIVVIETGQDLHQFVLIVSKLTGYSGIERIQGIVIIGREHWLYIMGERK